MARPKSRKIRALKRRARQTEAIIKTNRPQTDEYWLGADGLGNALRAMQIGGALVFGSAIYLAIWWMAANIFLWRAVGEASSRRARGALSGAVMGALLGLAALAVDWFWRESDPLATTVSSPQTQAQTQANEIFYGTVGAFAFAFAPWLLALGIAGATMWRHRAQFALAPRVDLELQLSRFSRRLLRWMLPIFVLGSALMLLFGWALAVVAARFSWRNVDLLALLPPDRYGATGSLFWSISDEPITLFYGLFLCVLCLLGWFCKWRWGTPHRLRPLTHRALRAWKESLGCAVAWLVWAFLLLILLGAPARTRAESRLNAVLKRGEISVMRDLNAHADLSIQ